MGAIIDGKSLSKEIKKLLKSSVYALHEKEIFPKLTVLFIGDNPASQIYVKNKEKAAKELGIISVVERFPAETKQDVVISRIRELNEDKSNHGILVQLPLPKGYNEALVLESINPEKDVDGFHPVNIGKLLAGGDCLKPCTPSGVIRLIESTGIDIAGKDAVIIGRSNIVGKPVAMMLLQKNATVTICHSKTIDLPEKIRSSDIVIAAIGRPEFIRGDWIKPGSVIIDVGINRLPDGQLKGDVQFDIAKAKAAFITPVPGGVGPMTITMLLSNTITAAKRQNNIVS